MEVPYDEGLASHIGPESCVCGRKAAGEALTGVRAGQVLSRERGSSSGCRRRQRVRKATQDTSLWREVSWPCVVGDPVHARKLHEREPGDPTTVPGRWPWGPGREPSGGTTAVNGRGKSDRPIDTWEASEQRWVRFPLAEEVEGRGLTEGNLPLQNKLRAQDRVRERYGEP
jgi:RNA-directed DNA polymerase